MRTPESYEEERRAIAASVDPEAIRLILNEYPPHGSLPKTLRSMFSVHDKLSVLSEEKIKGMIRYEEEQLIPSIARYERYRSEGIIAVSLFDLTISSGNNPLLAFKGALELTSNHVIYHKGKISELMAELVKFEDQLSLF